MNSEFLTVSFFEKSVSVKIYLRRTGFRNSIKDFYEMHTFSWNNKYGPDAPFFHRAADYNLDKPLVVGEFASVCSEGQSSGDLYLQFYEGNYSGAWIWALRDKGRDYSGCADGYQVGQDGMATIAGRSDHGHISINL